MPALVPKPSTASAKAASRTAGVRGAERIAAKDVVSSPADIRRNIAVRAAKPAWVTAMYQ